MHKGMCRQAQSCSGKDTFSSIRLFQNATRPPFLDYLVHPLHETPPPQSLREEVWKVFPDPPYCLILFFFLKTMERLGEMKCLNLLIVTVKLGA